MNAATLPAYIHPTAIVDPTSTIGDGAKIWHFAHVQGNAVIGRNVSLGQNVFVAPNVTVGDGCKLQNNVSLYDGVTLEDDVFCGPSCVFTNVHTPRAFVSRKAEFGKTLVKRGATIGANATIVCGPPNKSTTLGEYCFIAAGAVITRDVPAYALMAGAPGRRIGWVSRTGEVLRDGLVCPRTGERYEVVEGNLRPIA
jgi:UDP-2-acetamido-3-amino-2,3-dideoxy-glucuronate N-acetyltransferase